MRPGRGQSNKHGVSAVVIRGLSIVREPLRCFLIVSLRPSRLVFFIADRMYTEERGGSKKGRRKVLKRRAEVFLKYY